LSCELDPSDRNKILELLTQRIAQLSRIPKKVLALILPAFIGMLDFEMSALGQGPGFPEGRPLQMSHREQARPRQEQIKRKPAQAKPEHAKREPIIPKQVEMRVNKRAQLRSITHPETDLNWEHWINTPLYYRYRFGSRYLGNDNWERYLELENFGQQELHFSGVHYGQIRDLLDYVVKPKDLIQIKLISGPLATWRWDVATY
jgi:hypothetical protein